MNLASAARSHHSGRAWRSAVLLATAIALASSAAWAAMSRAERDGLTTNAPMAGANEAPATTLAAAPAREPARSSAIRALVQIRVVDDRGVAVARAHLFAHCRVVPEPRECLREALTDDQGCASLELAPVDVPWLVYVNWRDRTRPDHGRNALDVAVRGEEPQQHTVSLARLDANLIVTVVDDERRPVPNAAVLVDLEDRRATTSDDGEARFDRLPEGHLPITVALPTDSKLTLDGDGRHGITLHRGQTATATVVAYRRGAIALRLPGAAADARVDLEVVSARNGPQFVRQRASLSSGGVVTFNELPRGDYVVRANHPADSSWNSRANSPLTVSAGRTTHHVIEAAQAPGRMSGILVDQQGRGVSGARIRVMPLTGSADAASAKTTVSDVFGHFQLHGIEDAPLAVHVDVSSLANAHYRGLGEGITPYETHERPRAGVVLRLLPGHRVRGRLADRAGQPIVDCMISLRHEQAAIAQQTRTRRDRQPPRLGDTALDAGWYEFGHLAPGKYELSVQHGSGRARVNVDVCEGCDVLIADLVLEEGT